MYTLSLIGYIMIALLLMSMFAKARPKVKDPAPGKTLKMIPMRLSSRFQLHRSSLLALLTGIVFGWTAGWLSLSTVGIVIIVAVATLFLPMSYRFTTKGIALGDGIFYPWNNFSGFVAKGSSLKLNHPSLFGQLTLFVKPAEMDNVLEYVERYVRAK